jgi:hypothetical protein
LASVLGQSTDEADGAGLVGDTPPAEPAPIATAPAVTTPTAADPMKILVLGDSLSTFVGQQMAAQKVVGYLSAEYLLGRQLGNALLASDLTDIAEKGLALCGIDLATLRNQEVEPGLGNGGLGRLAACFIDSLATMVPCIGYGIRYEYGIFRRPSSTAARSSSPTPGCSSAPRGSSRTPSVRAGELRRSHRDVHVDEDGVEKSPWVPGWNVLGCPTTTWSPATSTARQHAAAVERPGDQRVRPADLQLRRLRPGRARPDLRREHLQGALPGGLDAAGQGAAPAAAVLLRRLRRCTTSSTRTLPRASTCIGCPSGSSSSSTTPTR